MLSTYQKAFKAYDVRGKYGSEIDEKLCYIMGKAIAGYLLPTNPNPQILIGSDVRLPNKSLITAFVAGLQESGVTNISCAHTGNQKFDWNLYPYGICSTPALYYIGHHEVDLAVAFTASHNPPEDVGMKFFDKTCTFLSQQLLIDLFTKYYSDQALPQLPDSIELPGFAKLGEKTDKMGYFLASKFANIQGNYRIAVDFSTGAGVALERALLQYLIPAERLILINDQPDGNFSAHLSETQEHHNYEQLISTIQANVADFGIMFDGDADRVGFAGPDGKVVGGDMILAIVAEQILHEQKAAGKQDSLILYEVMCSKIIAELVAKAGGTSKMVRMGRFFIKEAMEQFGALFAGETSGHFMFAEIGNYEMPLLVLAYVCKALDQYGSRAAMMNSVRKYAKSPVHSKVVTDKNTSLQTIKSEFSLFQQLEIDGISVYGDSFWFNVRASNTENKLRYTVEADSLEEMKTVLEKLESVMEK